MTPAEFFQQRVDANARELLIKALDAQDHERFQAHLDEGRIHPNQKLNVGGDCPLVWILQRPSNNAWAFWMLWETFQLGAWQLDKALHAAARHLSGGRRIEEQALRIVRHLVLSGANPDRTGFDQFTARAFGFNNYDCGALLNAIRSAEFERQRIFELGLESICGKPLPFGNYSRVFSRGLDKKAALQKPCSAPVPLDFESMLLPERTTP